MSKPCPKYGKAIYMDCLECEDKICKGDNMRNKIVVGIDQSYKDTGISIGFNNNIMLATHCYTKNLDNNSSKRKALQLMLYRVFEKVDAKSRELNADVIVIVERIRLQSQGFLNIDYIKSIGALNALIVDTAHGYDFPVYSADTRAWKSAVIGTSKEKKNRYGIDPKKFPTIVWCVNRGYKKYIIDYDTGRRKKGVISKDGKSYIYNDNIADSIGICLYGYTNGALLKQEH